MRKVIVFPILLLFLTGCSQAVKNRPVFSSDSSPLISRGLTVDQTEKEKRTTDANKEEKLEEQFINR